MIPEPMTAVSTDDLPITVKKEVKFRSVYFSYTRAGETHPVHCLCLVVGGHSWRLFFVSPVLVCEKGNPNWARGVPQESAN